jgi:uncharacterized protein YkwD
MPHNNKNTFFKKHLRHFIAKFWPHRYGFSWLISFTLIGSATLWLVFAASVNLQGDLNNDSKVDAADLSMMLTVFGTNTASADLNNDGQVNIRDLSILLENYGKSPDSELASETDCPNEKATDASNDALYAAVICMTNHARAYNNKPSLSENTPLRNAAEAKANDIVTCNEFSHTACGHPFDYWIIKDGYTNRCDGENIAWGQKTPYQVMTEWLNSPGHRANILNAKFKDIGIGVLDSPKGKVWVMDLGGC